MNNTSRQDELSQHRQDDILRKLCALLTDKYVCPEAAEQATRALRRIAIAVSRPISAALYAESITQKLQQITHDAHLRLVYDPDRVARMMQPNGQNNHPDGLALARSRNHGFERLERLKGNVGYVDIRHFFPPAISQETAAASMRWIADCDAVIIDLRNNTGGNPSMVQFLCSYFVGKEGPIHLSTITSRPRRTTIEYWTLPDVPGPRMHAVDLTILISGHTFSGGEEFAYNMKHLGRATLIGETTAGGANPAGIDIIDHGFYATIPHATSINPLTGSNWEGVGVKPHIAVPASTALEVAHMRTLTRQIDAAFDATAKEKLLWLREEVESHHHPTTVPIAVLKRYVGQYGDNHVLLEQGRLMYCRRFFRYRLIPLAKATFWLDGPAAGFESRVEFVSDASSTITHLIARFPDGRELVSPRKQQSRL